MVRIIFITYISPYWMRCYSPVQGIVPTQRLNLRPLQADSVPLSHLRILYYLQRNQIHLKTDPWCSTIPWNGFSSVQFSSLVMSNSLRPHESQHARHPCPSPTPSWGTPKFRVLMASFISILLCCFLPSRPLGLLICILGERHMYLVFLCLLSSPWTDIPRIPH